MISLQGLGFRYHAAGPRVLHDISLTINAGEKVLIAGRNGAGKTTLSKILSGLLPSAERSLLEGGYFFQGKKIGSYSRREIASRIAVLFQDFEAQIVSSSVAEEMLFYPMNIGMGYRAARQKMISIAEQFGIAGLLSRDMHELSGGEKQKTAFFSLLAVDPDLLILDEPFTDIEPSSQEYVLDFLGGTSFKGSLILFEQSLDYGRHFDRIVILHAGAILYDGDESGAYGRALLDKAGLDMPGLRKLFPGAAVATVKDAAGIAARQYAFDNEAYAALLREPARGTATPIIRVRGLSFTYKGMPGNVLENINLDIQQGDFVAILGSNGSGKTTLAKCIAGILRPRAGEVIYKGAKVKAGDIGYVYQNPDNQIFAETVFDEIAFALRMKKLPAGEIKKRVDAMLETMGLAAVAFQDPFTLPKGDRQKVACASILAAEPDVIILDEPTTGLDFPSLSEMMRIIKGLNDKGKTVLMITHSMEAAASFGRTVLAVKNGHILFYGPCRDFFNDADLLSESRASRTDIMKLSLELNNRPLLNAGEFLQCWKKQLERAE